MKRLLLLLPSNSYRAAAFVTACADVDAHVTIGVDEAQASTQFGDSRVVQFNFSDPVSGAREIKAFAADNPVDAIVPAEEEAVLLAAHAAQALDLLHNSVDAVTATRDKFRLRTVLTAAGFPQPIFKLLVDAKDLRNLDPVGFPCIVKPTNLAASRGVIRANDVSQLKAAFARISDILAGSMVDTPAILVEEYLSGEEVALDGLMDQGELHLLALFDKPDPLTGPYFPETIYITPSRKSSTECALIEQTVLDAAVALGLFNGPIHAELRINEGQIYLLEIAARSIGGRCGSSLRFAGGFSLERLILSHAIGEKGPGYQREQCAVGVMMIPVLKGGILRAVQGLDVARGVADVEAVHITIPLGQRVTPLPEGRHYLGFIFARSSRPETAEASLRRAYDALDIFIEPLKSGSHI